MQKVMETHEYIDEDVMHRRCTTRNENEFLEEKA
jgi:hypothetical protein